MYTHGSPSWPLKKNQGSFRKDSNFHHHGTKSRDLPPSPPKKKQIDTQHEFMFERRYIFHTNSVGIYAKFRGVFCASSSLEITIKTPTTLKSSNAFTSIPNGNKEIQHLWLDGEVIQHEGQQITLGQILRGFRIQRSFQVYYYFAQLPPATRKPAILIWMALVMSKPFPSI